MSRGNTEGRRSLCLQIHRRAIMLMIPHVVYQGFIVSNRTSAARSMQGVA